MWPRSAYLAIFTIIAVFSGLILLMYESTRSSYSAQGRNDGAIDQRLAIIDKLEQNVTIQKCRNLSGDPKPIEFFTLKTDTIYLVVSDKTHVSFCRD